MTPRTILQSLARTAGLPGAVQYVSEYARNAMYTSRPGWYITTNFDRRFSCVNDGLYLGRSYAESKVTIRQYA